MFLESFVRCAIVISITQLRFTQCNLSANNNNQPQNDFLVEASLIPVSENVISGEYVTFSDKSSSLDISDSDKNRNDRESLSSERIIRNLDTPYRKDDYDDYGGVSPAIGSSDLPECILSRSEFYLSWWVNDDGTLKLAANRPPGSPGFADLSVKFESEDTIFSHVASMQASNPNDVKTTKHLFPQPINGNFVSYQVITFMSIANNELSKLPVETLNLVNISLQYLSLANNNFNLLFLEKNKTFRK